MKVLFNKSTGDIQDRLSDDIVLSGLNEAYEMFTLASDIDETCTNISMLSADNVTAYQEYVLAKLETNAESYIYVDYPISNQTSLIAEKMDASGEKLTQINAIQAWIDSVLTEYYVRKAAIEAEETVTAIVSYVSTNTALDFSSFDSTKPSYTLRTVKAASNS